MCASSHPGKSFYISGPDSIYDTWWRFCLTSKPLLGPAGSPFFPLFALPQDAGWFRAHLFMYSGVFPRDWTFWGARSCFSPNGAFPFHISSPPLFFGVLCPLFLSFESSLCWSLESFFSFPPPINFVVVCLSDTAFVHSSLLEGSLFFNRRPPEFLAQVFFVAICCATV